MIAAITADAEVNWVIVYWLTPLWWAVNRVETGMVAALLAAGASVDEPCHGGDTPLVCTVRSGHAEVVAMLLAAHPARVPAG